MRNGFLIILMKNVSLMQYATMRLSHVILTNPTVVGALFSQQMCVVTTAITSKLLQLYQAMR